MDCSPPGSSVHGTFQARIREQIAISHPRRAPWPRYWTYVSWVSCTGSEFFITAPRGKPPNQLYFSNNNDSNNNTNNGTNSAGKATNSVICLTFGCPSAPLPVVTVGEGVAGQVPAEQVVPASFSCMPHQGRLEALPCDQGGLSSFWSQTDTEAPSACVRGTSHPGDSRGTGASWGYPVGIPQEGTWIFPHIPVPYFWQKTNCFQSM